VTPIEVVQVVLAAVTLVAFYYLSTYLVRLLGRPAARRFRRQSVAQTILREVRLGTLVLGTFVAAGILGLRFPDIVLSVTVFSAVLGLVLAPIIGSLIGGLFVLADQPYEVGDMGGRQRSARVRRRHHAPIHEAAHAGRHAPRHPQFRHPRARRGQLLRGGHSDPAPAGTESASDAGLGADRRATPSETDAEAGDDPTPNDDGGSGT
jgi:hypothetical protein